MSTKERKKETKTERKVSIGSKTFQSAQSALASTYGQQMKEVKCCCMYGRKNNKSNKERGKKKCSSYTFPTP